jgi:hypothetical protein
MRRAKSPSSLAASDTRLLGQDSRGHWVVKDSCGQFGAVFFNRTEAVKFALFDGANNRPRAVILVPGVIELDVLRARRKVRKAVADPISGANTADLQRVA